MTDFRADQTNTMTPPVTNIRAFLFQAKYASQQLCDRGDVHHLNLTSGAEGLELGCLLCL